MVGSDILFPQLKRGISITKLNKLEHFKNYIYVKISNFNKQKKRFCSQTTGDSVTGSTV